VSGHPCFLPDFRGNGFNFVPFSMMLGICLSCIPLLCLGAFLVFLVSSELLSWRILNYAKILFCIVMIKWVFVFGSIYVLYCVYWFTCIEPPLYLWMQLANGVWFFVLLNPCPVLEWV
jgi:hypothetical protein